MYATLDGQDLFGQQELEIQPDSINRASIERAVSGLNGLLSIDLGKRGRRIKQQGTLRAQSQSQMQDRINAISAYLDGNTHTLMIGSDEKFENVRMDVFRVSKKRPAGGGVVVDYEIVYTQLAV